MKWSEQLRVRERVHQKYPEVWALKIVKKRLPTVLEFLRDGETILEIGAGDRGLEKRIKMH